MRRYTFIIVCLLLLLLLFVVVVVVSYNYLVGCLFQVIIVAATLANATAALPLGSNGLGYVSCPFECWPGGFPGPEDSTSDGHFFRPMSTVVDAFPGMEERKTAKLITWHEATPLPSPSPKLQRVLALFEAQKRIFDDVTVPLLDKIGRQHPLHLRRDVQLGHQQFFPTPSLLEDFDCILNADYPPPANFLSVDFLSTPRLRL